MHPSELGAAVGHIERNARWRTRFVGFSALGAGAAIAVGALFFGGALSSDTNRPTSGSLAAPAALSETAAAAVIAVEIATPLGTVHQSGIALGGGRVLTGSQGLESASEIRVDTLPATLVGRDDVTDLALIETDATLAPAGLANSTSLEAGTPIVAVAAHSNGTHDMHTGTITNVDQMMKQANGELVTGLVTTDAPTDDAAVGGALFDTDGRVVAMIVASSDHESYAVPTDLARDITEQLAATGHADHGWIGILGTDDPRGVVASQVMADSPAAGAGIKTGDLVVAIDDDQLSGIGELAAEIRRRRPSDDVDVTYERSGERVTVRVVLAPYETSVATP